MAEPLSTSHMFGENIPGIGAFMNDHIGTGNGTSSVGDLPREKQSPCIQAEGMGISPQASTVCRYYAIGNCRRGSVCRFLHPLMESVQQGMEA